MFDLKLSPDVFPSSGDFGGIASRLRLTDQHAADAQPDQQAQPVLRPGMQGRLQRVAVLSAGPNMRGLLLAVQGARNPSQLQVSTGRKTWARTLCCARVDALRQGGHHMH